MPFTYTVNPVGGWELDDMSQPATFNGGVGVIGPQGPQGIQGITGVIAASPPIIYNSITQTVSIDTDPSFITILADNGINAISITGDFIQFDDGTQQVTAYTGGDLKAANNLSDLDNAGTARTNLGLGSIATASASDYYLATNPSAFITSSALTPYLTTASAASTYQPIASMGDYLTKAGNLSGITNSATARTNLGLGTMAVATASDYLDKAGNLSGLANTATARTNLGLGTAATSNTGDFAAAVHTHTASAITDFSAAVDALVPAASTTTSGKVEMATDLEAGPGVDTSRAITARALQYARVVPYVWGMYAADFVASTSGTGGLNDSIETGTGRRLNGPTSTGVGYVVAQHNIPALVGSYATGNMDWTKRIAIGGRITRVATSPSSNSFFRVTLGEPSNAFTGDPTVAAIGIKVTGAGAIDILAHNGTTLTTSATTHTPAASVSFDFLLTSDGAGNVTLFVNGSQVGTTTGGPTTLLAGTASNRRFYAKVENNSSFTASPQQYNIFTTSYSIG